MAAKRSTAIEVIELSAKDRELLAKLARGGRPVHELAVVLVECTPTLHRRKRSKPNGA
ncbi:MAG: hypothetical protein JWM53_6427 [bacterium]|nr:hypothetical protein [bacterium]